jgi:capsular exopolysaccharide synthesis family protein
MPTMDTRPPRDQDAPGGEPRSIDLRDYWRAVHRRWALVLALTLLGAVAGVGYGHFAKSTYAATAQVLVVPLNQGPINPPSQPNQQVNMSTEQSVAESGPVVVGAAKILNKPAAQLETEIGSQLTVTVPALSDVLEITWKGGTALAAQEGANAFATAYLQYRHGQLAGQLASLGADLGGQVDLLHAQVNKLEAQLNSLPTTAPQRQGLILDITELNGQLGTASNQLRDLSTYNDSGGSVIAAAVPPRTRSGLSHGAVLVLATLLGLLLGLVLAFVRDAFDDRVRDAVLLERELGAATLAVLPRTGGRGWMPDGLRDLRRSTAGPAITTVARPDSRAAEAIRSLRATFVAVGAAQDLQIILLASADRNESSSRIAAELGVALAESGRRTLLVAADLRGSALSQIFELSNTTGVSQLLAGAGNPEALPQHPSFAGGVALPGAIAGRLSLLPNGPLVAQPLSVLDSDAMVRLLENLRGIYDFVLLDCPPFNVADDVVALAGLVDGVVVVASEGRTRGRVLDQLRVRLDQVGAKLIGGVLVTRRVDRRKVGPSARRTQPVPRPAVTGAAERRGVLPEGARGLTELPA